MAATPQVPNRIANDRYATVGNSEDSLTALAGGGQTGATPLTGQLSRVTTVASSADSVSLPKITAEAKGFKLGPVLTVMHVRNDGANSMQVFGATPDTINGVATGTGVAVGAGKSAMFIAQSYTQSTNVGNWIMNLSA